MARILLIQATSLDPRGRPRRGPVSWVHGVTLPLLAACTPPGVEVRLCNDAVHRAPLDEPWDLVAISCMGTGLSRVAQLGRLARARGLPVIVGGRVATALPDEAALDVDAVVLGEAEAVWPDIVRDALAGRLAPRYGRADQRTALAGLPTPRYELVDRWRHGPYYPVEASRGCPHRCEYCTVAPWSGFRHRARPVSEVVRDIGALARLGIRRVAFVDDNLGADRAHLHELLAAITPLGIRWVSQLATTTLYDAPMVEKMARSGCDGVSIGFESVNPASLESVRKGWNQAERYTEGVELMRRHGITVAPLLVIGFDPDDASGMDALLDFLDRSRAGLPLMYLLTPAPGTALRERWAREGRLLDSPVDRHDLGHVVFRPAHLTPAALERLFWRTQRRAYSAIRILRRAARATSWRSRLAVLAMNVHVRATVRAREIPGAF